MFSECQMMTSSTEVLSSGSLHDIGDVIHTPVRRNKQRNVNSPGVLSKDISGECWSVWTQVQLDILLSIVYHFMMS